MKLTVKELMNLWEALFDVDIANDQLPEKFSIWMKRFRVIARPESQFWNTLTPEERVLIIEDEVEIKMDKLDPKHRPDVVPPDIHKWIALIFAGDIEKETSRLETLLTTKKGKNDET